MGFNISWLAVRGQERASFLSNLGLVATGEVQGYPQGMECLCTLPGGVLLLFLNHPWHRFTESEILASLSHGCEITGCRIEEHNMSSAVFVWRNGEPQWSVIHAAERNVRNLHITGTPPTELEALRAIALQQQNSERGPFSLFGLLRAEFDHFFRVPIDLAAKLVGYEHDKVRQAWGEARYELLSNQALH
jgi:hypothetical protein